MIKRYEQVGLRAAWIIAIAAPCAAALLMVPLRTHTQPGNLALVMVAVVAAAAVPGFRLAAIAAGVSAGVWFDFFLARPYQTLSIQHGAPRLAERSSEPTVGLCRAARRTVPSIWPVYRGPHHD